MLKRILSKSEFFSNVIKLMTGSAVSQLIPFLILPVLQRWFFNPEDFGVLAVYITFSTLFINISSLKYEFAIVLHKKLKDAVNLLVLALSIVALCSFLSFILIFLLKNEITMYFNNNGLSGFIYLVPVSVFCSGGYSVFSYWNNRKKKFKLIAVSKVFQSTSAEVTKLGNGIVGLSSGGLIIGRVTGQVISFFILLIHFIRNDIKAFKLISLSHIKSLAKKSKKFPLYTTPSTFIVALNQYTFISLFLKFYGAEYVGMIGVSMSYIAAGTGVISTSISQVFYREIADIKSVNSLNTLYLTFAKKLFVLSAFLVTVVYILPTEWVVYILGDQWAELMGVVRVLVLWLGISFVSTSLGFIYIKLERQRFMLFCVFIHWLMIIAAIFGGHYIYGEFHSTLWLFTGVQMIYYSFAIIAAIVFINRWKPNTKL